MERCRVERKWLRPGDRIEKFASSCHYSLRSKHVGKGENEEGREGPVLRRWGQETNSGVVFRVVHIGQVMAGISTPVGLHPLGEGYSNCFLLLLWQISVNPVS